MHPGCCCLLINMHPGTCPARMQLYSAIWLHLAQTTPHAAHAAQPASTASTHLLGVVSEVQCAKLHHTHDACHLRLLTLDLNRPLLALALGRLLLLLLLLRAVLILVIRSVLLLHRCC
jgi:hypothetical protein